MTRRQDDFDSNRSHPRHDPLEALLHPAQAFTHPMDVVRDHDLTLAEKRAILSAWASDACAVEAAPALRRPPGGPVIRFDDIMDALRVLDRESDGFKPPPRYRRVLAQRRGPRGQPPEQGGHPLG
jgi:hypothetical protein